MDRYRYILGCLLGTAVGDAVGLRREGLSRQRPVRMYGGAPLQPTLFLGRGFCSDDTEHTLIVGRSLVVAAGDSARFQNELARQLKLWMLTLPAGVGFATLKACFKLLVGVSPSQSGVSSAGNGPAMRSALLGIWATSDEELTELVRINTRITHTDPRAEEGALLVAQAARLTASENRIEPREFLEKALDSIAGKQLRDTLKDALAALSEGRSCQQFAESQGWSRGISGYINQSVPAALYCWANSPLDFRQAVENAVLLGGDSDSVAAITGAVCGANLGAEQIPDVWVNKLAEWPRTTTWMEQLARSVSEAIEDRPLADLPSMHWGKTLFRNLFFTTVVLGIGFRRLLPPY